MNLRDIIFSRLDLIVEHGYDVVLWPKTPEVIAQEFIDHDEVVPEITRDVTKIAEFVREWKKGKRSIKEIVCEALNNAYTGGYSEIAMEVPGAVALDLLDKADEVFEWMTRYRKKEMTPTSGMGIKTLVPIIEEWQKGKAGA